jgi:hypothetical protein
MFGHQRLFSALQDPITLPHPRARLPWRKSSRVCVVACNDLPQRSSRHERMFVSETVPIAWE